MANLILDHRWFIYEIQCIQNVSLSSRTNTHISRDTFPPPPPNTKRNIHVLNRSHVTCVVNLSLNRESSKHERTHYVNNPGGELQVTFNHNLAHGRFDVCNQ